MANKLKNVLANESGNVTITGTLIGTSADFQPDADSMLRIRNAGTNAISIFADTGDTLYLGGNNTTGMYLDASAHAWFVGNINIAASQKIYLGGSTARMHVYHTGSGGSANVLNKEGALNFILQVQDANMVFSADNGETNSTQADYFYLDGGSATHDGSITTAMYTIWKDYSRVAFGNGKDLQLWHDGTTSTIYNSTGNLHITCATDDSDIRFYGHDGGSGVTEYFRVDGGIHANIFSQNVGIGTASPSSNLHVEGAPSNGTYLAYLYNSGTHNSSHGLNVQTAATNIAAYGLRVNTGSDSSALAVMGNGNTGIGTATPYTKLDVNGELGMRSGNKIGWIYNPSTDNNMYNYLKTDTDSGTAASHLEISGARWTNGNTASVKFTHQTGGDIMTIMTGGNVGIGTATPDKKLHVAGGNNNVQAWLGDTGYTRADMRLGGDNAAGGRLYFQYNGDSSYIDSYGGHGSTARYRDLQIACRDLKFTTGPATTLGNSMIIKSDGTVGIGTPNPDNYHSSADNLVISGDGHPGMTIDGGSDKNCSIFFADGVTGDQAYRGIIQYQHDVDSLVLYTAASLALTINSSQNATFEGDVIVKNTSPAIQLYNTDDSLANDQTLGDLEWYQVDPSDQGVGVVARIRGINGGSTAGAGDIEFQTGTATSLATRLTINYSGNVGIGTVTPQKQLQIKETTTTAAVYYPLSVGGSNHVTGYAVGIGLDPEGYGNRNKIAIVAEGTAAGYSRGKLHFLLDSANDSGEATLSESKMVIQENGSVGIGTSSPGVKFQVVESTASWTGDFKNYTTNGYGLRVDMSGASSSNGYVLGAYSPAGVGLFLNGSGNVAVGTTTFKKKLTVYGGNDNGIWVDSQGAQYTSVAWGHSGTEKANIAWDNTNTNFSVTAYGSTGTITTVTNGAEKMKVSSAGEIIIGTGSSNAGFLDFDGTNLQFNTQRNPNSGAFVDTGKSHAHIGLQGADGGSQIVFGTAAANNTTSTTRLTIGADGTSTFAGDVTVTKSSAAIQVNESGGATTKVVAGGSLGYIGTYSNHALQLLTNSTLALTVNASGSVSFTQSLYLPDSKSLYLGAGSDLRLYHDGSNSYISDSNASSDLIIQSNHILLQAPSGENMIFCNEDAEVKLYYNNSAKLQTLDTGVNVIGGISASGTSAVTCDGATKALAISNVGSTSATTMSIKTSGTASGASSLDIHQVNTIYGPSAIQFFYGSTSTTAVGYIRAASSSTTYSTSSDYRLKENVVELTGALDRIGDLKPKRFNFINNPDVTVDGFLAHEAQEVVPQAITGEKDEEINGKPSYQGIDHGFIVPLLTAAIKELKAQNEDLLARVKALENK